MFYLNIFLFSIYISMSGKYFYKNSDITNFFVYGTTTVTGFNGISYESGANVLMEKPTVFNMTTPTGDISQLMKTNFTPLTTVGPGNLTVPSNHNAFSAFIMGGGGGGGGGGGCGYFNGNSGRSSGGDGSPGGNGNMTISYPYVPILPGSTISYYVGDSGNSGAGGIDCPTHPGSPLNGTAGSPGNSGQQSYITFTPASATTPSGPSPSPPIIAPTSITPSAPTVPTVPSVPSSSIRLYANGGAGGKGGLPGMAYVTASNAIQPYANSATNYTVGPTVYYSPSPTYSTGSYTSTIAPTTNVTTNIGTSPAGNTINNTQFSYLTNISLEGYGGYRSQKGNPLPAAAGNAAKEGYIHIYYYKI